MYYIKRVTEEEGKRLSHVVGADKDLKAAVNKMREFRQEDPTKVFHLSTLPTNRSVE